MSKQKRDYILFGIDIEAVWDTVRNNIPPFKKQIVNVLESEKGAKND